MSPQEKVGPHVNEAAIVRAVLPRHTVKRLAALMNVPLGTAHEWLYRTFSASRRREIATALLAQLDREDEQRQVYRRQLTEMAANDDQVAGSLASAFVPKDRRARARNTAPARGILVQEVMLWSHRTPSRRQRMRR